MRQRLRRPCAVALLAIASLASAYAQVYTDPTRPPAELLAPRAGAARAVALASPSSEPQLQSVLVSKRPGGRRIAVIDGQTVRVGALVNGARVTAIGAKEVTLQRGKESQVLKLFPIQSTAQASTQQPTASPLAQPGGTVRPAVPLVTLAPQALAGSAPTAPAASAAKQ